MKPIVELIRLEENDQFGTFGVLRIQKEVFCVTLEPADLLNAPQTSSIPAQQYLIKRHNSPKFGETFQVMDVPGRSAVLIHAGNVVGNTQGCIILGQFFGKLKEGRAVLNSGATFQAFMEAMAGYEVGHLTIKEVY
jgi:hypothetical protein